MYSKRSKPVLLNRNAWKRARSGSGLSTNEGPSAKKVCPELEIPKIQTPRFETPRVIPEVDAPMVEIPRVIPEVDAPMVETPRVIPKVDAPMVEIPRIIPEVEAPMVESPGVIPRNPVVLLSDVYQYARKQSITNIFVIETLLEFPDQIFTSIFTTSAPETDAEAREFDEMFPGFPHLDPEYW